MFRSLMLALSLTLATTSFVQAGSPIDPIDAARAGDIVALKTYKDSGGDLEVRTARGYTPFIMAAYYGETAVLRYLKAEGADVCAVDEMGSNAFMGVAFRGHVDPLKWLLANTDCGINRQNAAGQTALMMASLFGREEIVALLLEAGADPKIKDYQGNTAESLANAQGLTKIVKMVRFPFGK